MHLILCCYSILIIFQNFMLPDKTFMLTFWKYPFLVLRSRLKQKIICILLFAWLLSLLVFLHVFKFYLSIMAFLCTLVINGLFSSLKILFFTGTWLGKTQMKILSNSGYSKVTLILIFSSSSTFKFFHIKKKLATK